MSKLRNIIKSISKFNNNDGAFEMTVEKVLIIGFVMAFVIIAGIGISKSGVNAVNGTTSKIDAAPGAVETGLSGVQVTP